MKAILLIISLFFITLVEAQVARTVELTAGSLDTELTTQERNTIIDLTITGTVDARDFRILRDSMPALETLDMSDAQIVAYEGDEGTSKATTVYEADVLPREAFQFYFTDMPSLVSVKIPRTTKIIGPYAFFGFVKLTSFAIPPSVTTVQAHAFGGCYNLATILIPESVESIEEYAFSGCSALTAVTLPSKVDSIQNSTFAHCELLNLIKIPSSVTYIGDNAFTACNALSSIDFPSALKTIGKYAFYQCGSLGGLTLPDGVTAIGEGAFMDCWNLAEPIVLSQGLSAIAPSTFSGCSTLHTVEIPASVDSIGEAAFLRCTNLATAPLPPSLVYIGNSAFAECVNLTGPLTLPASLHTIGYRAFADCMKLSGELIIPPLVTVIPYQAFSYCKSLTSVVIPSSVTAIQSEAFASLLSLNDVVVHHLYPLSLHSYMEVFRGVDKASVTLHVPFGTRERYASAYGWEDFGTIVEATEGFLLSATSLSFTPEGGSDNSIEVTADFAWTATTDQDWLTVSPSSGEGSQRLAISAEANTGLSSREATITLSADDIASQTIRVKQHSDTRELTITPGGLYDALSWEEQQTISSLTLNGTMDARDFRTIRFFMPLLEELDIREVDIVAYTDTTYGNQIEHPADAIPFAIHEWSDDFQTDHALSEHKKLRVVKLPHSLKIIGYRAFFGCSSLTTVEMSSSVERIGEEAFAGCGALTSINLPASLTTISEAAFMWCTSLVTLELPSSLTKIEYETFMDCRALESIVIPSSITEIGDYAFKGCMSLESVTLPSSLTTISIEAFRDCSSLTTLEIPQGVTTIAGAAFQGGSDLVSLTLPASLTSMGYSAFADCTSLDIIYSYAVNPPDLDNDGLSWVFDNVDKENCLLYVPAGARELYAVAYEWEDFENIIEMGRFSLEDTTLTVEAADNSEAMVKLHSTLAWTANSDQEWLSVSPASGSGDQWLTLMADANPGDTSRIALVTIKAEGMDYPLILTVTQRGRPVGTDPMETRARVSAYPNPFATEMSIDIANPSLEAVNVDIYSISGQKIKTLARALKGQRISLVWKGEDETGRQVPEGMYLVKMNGEVRKVVKK